MPVETGADDFLTLSRQIKSQTAELQNLVATLKDNAAAQGHTQTIAVKYNMGGFVAGIAVAACVCSMFVTMFIARSIANEMRDMKAWQDVMRGKITVLEGKVQTPPIGGKQQ